MSRQIIAWLIMVAIGVTVSLVSGASYLEISLPGGLPIGNALAAIGLCSAAGAAVGLSQSGTSLRRISAASFVAAIGWLPISVVLAGNLALNFKEPHGFAWLGLSLATVLAVLGSLAWAVVRLLLKGRPNAGSSTAA
jgi:hypothetical protein